MLPADIPGRSTFTPRRLVLTELSPKLIERLGGSARLLPLVGPEAGVRKSAGPGPGRSPDDPTFRSAEDRREAAESSCGSSESGSVNRPRRPAAGGRTVRFREPAAGRQLMDEGRARAIRENIATLIPRARFKRLPNGFKQRLEKSRRRGRARKLLGAPRAPRAAPSRQARRAAPRVAGGRQAPGNGSARTRPTRATRLALRAYIDALDRAGDPSR